MCCKTPASNAMTTIKQANNRDAKIMQKETSGLFLIVITEINPIVTGKI